jgi:hypothetical protein
MQRSPVAIKKECSTIMCPIHIITNTAELLANRESVSAHTFDHRYWFATDVSINRQNWRFFSLLDRKGNLEFTQGLCWPDFEIKRTNFFREFVGLSDEIASCSNSRFLFDFSFILYPQLCYPDPKFLTNFKEVCPVRFLERELAVSTFLTTLSGIGAAIHSWDLQGVLMLNPSQPPLLEYIAGRFSSNRKSTSRPLFLDFFPHSNGSVKMLAFTSSRLALPRVLIA